MAFRHKFRFSALLTLPLLASGCAVSLTTPENVAPVIEPIFPPELPPSVPEFHGARVGPDVLRSRLEAE